jgi:hypothetical protein
VKDAYRAPYITALVTDMLDLETTMLHVLDPMVGCICTAIMVASPLFPYFIFKGVNIGDGILEFSLRLELDYEKSGSALRRYNHIWLCFREWPKLTQGSIVYCSTIGP